MLTKVFIIILKMWRKEKLRISKEIIMHNIQLKNTRKLVRKTCFFLSHFSLLFPPGAAECSFKAGFRRSYKTGGKFFQRKVKIRSRGYLCFCSSPAFRRSWATVAAAEHDFLHSATQWPRLELVFYFAKD